LRSNHTINPGDDRAPLPVVIRIYQLKDRAKFDAADLRMIWQDDATVLGSDLVEKNELTLFPDGRETRTLARKSEAMFVAVVAIFRKTIGSNWKAVVELPDLAAVQKSCKKTKGGTRRAASIDRQIVVEGSQLQVNVMKKVAAK